MLKRMVGAQRHQEIRTEECIIRARAGVANISEIIRDGKLIWLRHVERKAEEDVAMKYVTEWTS